MKVYLVRHGEVPHNVMKKYSSSDEDLTLNGIKEAEALKESIKDIEFDVIFSSPYQRAKHTAKIITNNKDIVVDKLLKERDCGSLNEQPLESTDREEYWNYYTTIQYGTSENIKEFFSRIFTFLNNLKEKNYKNVLIVAHSGVSKAFSAYFEGINNGKFLNRGLKNCEMKIYDLK